MMIKYPDDNLRRRLVHVGDVVMGVSGPQTHVRFLFARRPSCAFLALRTEGKPWPWSARLLFSKVRG